MEGTYLKGGSAGSKGVDFQVGLIEIFLLNALRRLKNWKLSTENKKAGKFDDIVLELDGSGATLLQAKFKENTKTKITSNHLLSINSKSDDFSIPKYFFSYEEVKKSFLVEKVIICTNANVDKTSLDLLKGQMICSDSMLYYEDSSCLIYTFNGEILPVLRENVENYYKINLKGKDIDKIVINENNLREFLQHLQIYFNYPPENNLEAVTEQLLFDLKRTHELWHKASVMDIHNKLKEWFQQPRGEYLTERRARAMFCEIRSNKYCQKLESYNLSFVKNNLKFAVSKKVFHLVTEDEYLMKVARIHQALRKFKKKVLYVDPEDDAELQRETIDAFELPSYSFLIIIRQKFTEEYALKEIGHKLNQILEKHSHKKVVLVDYNNSKLVQQIGMVTESKEVIKDSATFSNLSKVVQKKLLEERNIVLQGYDLTLKELLGIQTTEYYNENIHSELLERLIKNEKVHIGVPIPDLDENISRNYIERMFEREILTGEDDMRVDVFSERDIDEIREKFIVFADSAGTGKSTVLSSLALRIKEKHPDLWVLKIELKSCIRFLSNSLKKDKRTVNINEVLDSTDTNKLKNRSEKSIFSLRNRVVLMMDGFDEISPYYTNLVLSLFEECIQAPNFAKVFATTRPHMISELKARFNVTSFKLQPLTEENQIHFFKSYWAHNLNLNEENRKKCEQYARTLVEHMWMYLDSDNFTGVPLHLRLLAENFQENNEAQELSKWKGCKEYLDMQEEELILPQKMNITELYKIFVDRKKDLFLEKENPTGNELVNEALGDIFDNCLAYHRTLALEVILEKELCELFTTYEEGKNSKETNVLMMGIVQKFDNDFHFVHKTFAEYFFGETLLAELQKRNENLEFQKFFIDRILLSDEFKVARAFLDWFLRRVVDSLPSDIFSAYQCHEQEIDLNEICRLDLIHMLAKEGCVAILQLILKCVDFKVIKGAEIHVKDLHKIYGSSCTAVVKGKTLNSIKLLIDRAGVNIKDETGWTPLHYAVHRLQVEMVEFLMEHGADMYNQDEEGRTAIQIAHRYYRLSLAIKKSKKEFNFSIQTQSAIEEPSSFKQFIKFHSIKKLFRRHRAAVKVESAEEHDPPTLSRADQAKSNYIFSYLMESSSASSGSSY